MSDRTEIKELLKKLNSWQQLIQEDGYMSVADDEDEVRVTIKEAFMTADAPILFPKIISRTLKEAAEPQFLVTPLLSTVRLGKGRSLEFPAVNAIQADEVAEGQEYPDQALAFAKQVEGKVSKKGVKVSFTDEVISDSLWDIVSLHVRAAGRAMARLKEQIALDRFADSASIVFDNDDVGVDDTTGLGSDGTANGSMTWDDLIDMAGLLMAENHRPTDLILHPLMWSVFLRDAVFHAGGANAGSAWNYNLGSKEGTLQSSAPLGLNVMVSPFVSFTARDGATPAKSDVFLIDRNEIGALLVKEDLSTENFDDPTRDIQALKMKERYDIVAFGDGEGITVAKNVSLARNYEVQLTQEIAS